MEEENIASVHVKEEGRRERVEGVLTQRKVAQDQSLPAFTSARYIITNRCTRSLRARESMWPIPFGPPSGMSEVQFLH